MSIYAELIERFTEDGLSSAQQAEIDAIRLATRFDDDDTLWGVVLPIYFLSNRREQARVDQEALLRAIQNVSTGGVDADRLGKAVARHIDATEIEVPAPEIDPAKIAKAVARAAVPEIRGVIEIELSSRVLKLDADAAHAALRGAVSDTLFSWQVAAGVGAALLIAIAAYWWGGKQVEWRDQPVMAQMQSQIQQTRAEPVAPNRRR
uniref:Transmembrane protein n=1 Tax=mine drainage metagenome TaxID=410659 RepID=E6QPF1_9ZZZZ